MHTELSGWLPSELGNVPMLRSLVFFANRISGFIPSELGLLTHIDRMWVAFFYDDQLPGVNWGLFMGRAANNGVCVRARVCWLMDVRELYWNEFSGTIPSSLGSLTEMTSFSSGDGNSLSGVYMRDSHPHY